MNIIVVGHGRWGTALSTLFIKNNKEFSFWEAENDLPDNSIIINALPTQVIRKVYSEHGKNLKNFIFVNGAKGIEQNTNKLPYEIISEILGKNIDYFSLIGPGFSEEIVNEMPTLVNLGFINNKNSELIKGLFQTDYFRVRLAKGVVGLELASGFKNVYAIACGIAEGLGFGTNTRTKLILIALEEFYLLSKKLSISISEEMLPGTIGDLILTCSSEESRNFRFGEMLATKTTEESLKEIGETVEGFYTADSIDHFEQKAKVKLELANFVHRVVKENNPSTVRSKFMDFVKKI